MIRVAIKLTTTNTEIVIDANTKNIRKGFPVTGKTAAVLAPKTAGDNAPRTAGAEAPKTCPEVEPVPLVPDDESAMGF